jgi:hypothetical protein
MNFNISTHPVERQLVYDKFKPKAWVTTEEPNGSAAGRKQYLSNIYRHKFCICPRGNGIDTVRMWEALYLRTIPIVKKSPALASFQDLPILFIDNWEEVTPAFLEAAYKLIFASQWNMAKMTLQYWQNLVAETALKKVHMGQFKPNLNLVSFGSSLCYLAHSNTLLNKIFMAHAGTAVVSKHLFGMEDLPNRILTLPDSIRGFKNWIWKPYVILKALLNATDNSVIFYTDGRSDIDGPLLWLQQFAENCTDDVLAYQMAYVEQQWTNGDMLHEFGIQFDSEHATSGQYMAGCIAIRKTVPSVNLVKQWLQFMLDNYVMCSMAPSQLPNHCTFIENRNDQSVLSLLLKTQAIPDLKIRKLQTLAPYAPHKKEHCNSICLVSEGQSKNGPCYL